MALQEHRPVAGPGVVARRAGTALLAGCLWLGAGADAQDAGQRVHRCIGAQGEVVFSGLPCTPTPATAAVADDTGDAASALACPTSPVELVARVRTAIERHDANALAALLRWDGYGGAAASARMGELRALVAPPLLGLDGGAGQLEVRTGGGAAGPVRTLDFTVRSDGSCQWLDW